MTTLTIVQRMALDLGISVATLQRLARSAPHRYKVFEIPKRSGSGVRVIAQPAKEIKSLQRWLVKNEFSILRIHHAATAYEKGSSIRDNAARHVTNRFLLKLDFKEFFPSIKENDLRMHLMAEMPARYSESEISFICRLSMWIPRGDNGLELCIGAPSSPVLSNAIMYGFDESLSAYCVIAGIAYTRYADDLSFSSNRPDHLKSVLPYVRDVIHRASYPTLTINEKKTVYTSKKYRRTVTGLVLSSEGRVSLGRERKREIRAMMHRFVLQKLNLEECARLRGILAFVQDVEPSFLRSLEDHYSKGQVDQVRLFDI
jgi:RNA-directed DNA polymerase